MRPIAALALLAGVSFAHDLELTVRPARPAVIVHATYAGTDPAAYCQVWVHSPADPKREFQNGRTDAKGVFSFVPDRAGTWRFILDDETGHRKEIEIPVAAESLEVVGAPAVQGTFQQLVTGLSTILGITGIWLWWRARRS